MTPPDARIVEDVIERGRLSLLRSARDDEAAQQAIEVAAAWLCDRARVLRELR